MIKLLELFGGIGACTQAFKNLGIPFQVVDYVEIDKYAVASYNAMNGTSFEPQDITKWDKEIDVDFIIHGSPCQDFSIAGKQAGGDEGSGTRSSLMYETLRIVSKLKPKYVVWENVKNMVSKKHIHNFKKYIDTMTENGYNSYYKIMNSKNYGIPQNRERVFTISIRKDIDKGYEFPKPEPLQLKLKDMLEENVDEKYYLSDKMKSYISKTGSGNYKNNDSKINLDIARPITTDPNKRAGTTNYLSEDAPANFDLKQIGQIYGTEKEPNPQAGRIYDSDGIAPTLDTCSGGNRMPKIQEKTYNLKEQLCNRLIEENKVKENDVIRHSYSTSRMKKFYTQNKSNNNISPTLDTRCDCLGIAVKNNTKKGYLIAKPGDGVYTNISTKRGTVQKEMIQTLTSFNDKGVVLPDLRIRKLTPRECWRLMAFPDEAFEKAEKVNSNTQLYKQAGNSIVVKVLEKIIEKMMEN